MQAMPPSHIRALIDLLGRETGDQAAFLRTELAHVVKEQPQLLKQVIEQDFHSAVPLAFVHAMQEVGWDNLTADMLRFSTNINPDLEEGLALITRFVNPAVPNEEITQQINTLADGLRPLLAACHTPAEMLQKMSQFFFKTQGYQVLPAITRLREMSFGRFLRKKVGSALCLGALYTVCARRLGMEAGLIDMAGRVLVYCTTAESADPLFADPLNNGSLMTLKDCQNYIFLRDLEWSEHFVTPLSSRAVIRRFLGNMIFFLNKSHDERRLGYLRRYMDILKN